MKFLKTAHELYTSTEFRTLRKTLMAERADENGVLRCEYCQKPIIKDYECIAHHKTEVTANNLNDPSVTLNPENIQLVHLRCHNLIHDRFGYSQKKVYFVWGAPCSGKSTFVKAQKMPGDLVVDIDLIWQAITGGEKYTKPEQLKQNVFMTRDALLEQVKTRAGKWRQAYVISAEPRRRVREGYIEALNAEPIYLTIDRETALKRLYGDTERISVRSSWEIYINNFFDRVEE